MKWNDDSTRNFGLLLIRVGICLILAGYGLQSPAPIAYACGVITLFVFQFELSDFEIGKKGVSNND